MEDEHSKEPGGEAVAPARQESTRSVSGEEPHHPHPEKKQRCRLDGQETKGSKFITSNSSDFSDPVYKEIAITNGCINRMSKEELRAKLSEFKLETRGVKDVLKKRLKNYYKKQKLMLKEDSGAGGYYDYICIIDFEATCEEGNPPEFLHEIIEFPVVLLNTHTLEIEDTFQQYVRPENNTQLSDFCINLTGITQDQVDRADTFPQVLKKVIDWMKLKELGTKYKYCILTDGSWDMSKFLNIQCQLSRLKYPPFAKKWINIRKSYGNFYKDFNLGVDLMGYRMRASLTSLDNANSFLKRLYQFAPSPEECLELAVVPCLYQHLVPRSQTKLTIMLEKLGMDYDGRPHSGLDDSKNIARIAVRMLQDGCELRINERMHAGQLMSVSSSLPIEGAPPPQMPHSRK